ncbi:phosphoenolpyruvate hydrolase family protein [Christensenellaceae bacterium OttesenSCG-928-K19]|nr:phosphoenolpyruvate hydrolase family protein [Christensenellaceae bacterium OttesenSCG-928-K19]
MAKRYTRKEVVARLREQIDKGIPLFMPNCGCGLTAKLQEEGGSDLICVSPTSWWRMKGCGSLSAFLPYCDCNQIIRDLAPEVLANVEEAPVVSLSGPHNPLLPHDKLLDEIWEMGLSGINPMMAHLYDPPFNEQIEKIGMGFTNEVEITKLARKREMFTFCYAYTPEDAKIFAQAGADVVAGHVGTTQGGKIGAITKLTLEQACERTQEIFDAARAENPDVILFSHGGPIVTADDAAVVFRQTSADGFVGGSAAERLPIEVAVLEATQSYKEYRR